jgi:hypothetical protein
MFPAFAGHDIADGLRGYPELVRQIPIGCIFGSIQVPDMFYLIFGKLRDAMP